MYTVHVAAFSMVHYTPDPNISSEKSDWLSTLFDVGGIVGKLSFHLL